VTDRQRVGGARETRVTDRTTRGSDLPLEPDVASQLDQLTPRELDILREMAQGKTNAAIGATLFLTEHSVEKYVSAVLAKLGLSRAGDVHPRVAAVLVYLRESRAEP
jgi:DNA-binding NarL/FixJ family response regulator